MNRSGNEPNRDTLPIKLAFCWGVYRCLLYAYPLEFRAEYGHEMGQVFRQRCRDAARGNESLSRLCLGTLPDLVWTAAKEHAQIIASDLSYAGRMLAKSPGSALAIALTLALGIGASSLVFSILNGVVLQPLPYPDAERLVWLSGTNPTVGIADEAASMPDFKDWKQQSRSFEALAACANTLLTLTERGEPDQLRVGLVDADFFRVLRARPLHGRTFSQSEMTQGKDKVVILSYGLWQRAFAGVPRAVGSTVRLNGTPQEVVGIMPEDFRHPAEAQKDAWVPLAVGDRGRRSDFLGVVGRLKESVPLEQARAEMKGIAAQLARAYPDTNQNWGVLVTPLHERLVGRVQLALYVLIGAVGFLLLIACVNVANILLAKAGMRFRELAIRTTLGARRRRLVRQLLVESLLLAVIGGTGGVFFAFAGVRALKWWNPEDIPRLEAVTVDARVLWFTLAVSVLTGVAFGLLPALRLTGSSLNVLLKKGGRGSGSPIHAGTARALSVLEFSLTLVLLAGSLLLIRSFLELRAVDPGFRPAGITTARLVLPRTKYPATAQSVAFWERLSKEAARLPGVESASVVTDLPFAGGGNYLAFGIQGRPPAGPDQASDAIVSAATEDYFKGMAIPLQSGRLFTHTDRQGSPLVAIVDRTFVDRYLKGENPLGKRVNFGSGDGNEWREIVGVVGPIRYESLDTAPYPHLYSPIAQIGSRSAWLVLRARSESQVLAPAIRRVIARLDRDLPARDVRTMTALLSASLSQRRFNMLLLAAFAGLALALAAVGVYGVESYCANQRVQELGVRLALGATQRDVIRLVLGQSLKTFAISLVIGLGAALCLTRLLGSLLFATRPADPLVFTAVVLILGAVGLVAAWLPARRAARVDPVKVLACE